MLLCQFARVFEAFLFNKNEIILKYLRCFVCSDVMCAFFYGVKKRENAFRRCVDA